MESFFVECSLKIQDLAYRPVNDCSVGRDRFCHGSSPDGLCCSNLGHHVVDHNVRCGLDDHDNRHHKDQQHSHLKTLPIQKVISFFSSCPSPLTALCQYQTI